MKQALRMSATDYCRPQKLHELEDSVLKFLPVSSYQLPDGSHQVISEYGNDEWRLEDARFPSNIRDNNKKIRFKTIPSQFVDAVKFALKHYDIEQNPSGNTLTRLFENLKPFLAHLNNIKAQNIADITPLHCANYVHRKRPTAPYLI